MGCEFDDNSLPPVDVHIPDDASELERDVQAYHREMRWRRRRERWGSLQASTGRFDTVMPLIVAIMLIVTISAVVLAVTAHPGDDGPRRQASSNVDSAVSGDIGGPLPDARVVVNGAARPLRQLHPSVLLMTSGPCRCGPSLDALATRARAYGIPVYLVESGDDGERSWIHAAQVKGKERPAIARDPAGALERAYDVSGLTAVLVNREGDVTAVLNDASTSTDWKTQLAPLRGSWDQGSGSARGGE